MFRDLDPCGGSHWSSPTLPKGPQYPESRHILQWSVAQQLRRARQAGVLSLCVLTAAPVALAVLSAANEHLVLCWITVYTIKWDTGTGVGWGFRLRMHWEAREGFIGVLFFISLDRVKEQAF